MSDHECDGEDCCGLQPGKVLVMRGISELSVVSERLAFLETRRVELQEMCERRSRELIEANERIAFLERLVGRLIADRES